MSPVGQVQTWARQDPLPTKPCYMGARSRQGRTRRSASAPPILLAQAAFAMWADIGTAQKGGAPGPPRRLGSRTLGVRQRPGGKRPGNPTFLKVPFSASVLV